MEIHEGELLDKFIKELGYNNASVGKKIGVSANTVGNQCRDTPVSKLYKAALEKYVGIAEESFEKGELIRKHQGAGKVVSYSIYKEKAKVAKKPKESAYKQFLTDYFEAIVGEVKKAKKSIVVVDYLKTGFHVYHKGINGKNKKDHTQLFGNLYSDYLSVIENHVLSFKAKREIISYVRYYQCPIDVEKKNKEESKRRAIGLLYTPTIDHICSLKQKKAIEARLLLKPIRPYSYMIIDNRILITEYIRFTHSGNSKPDILIIEEIANEETNSMTSDLIDSLNSRLSEIKQDVHIEDSIDLTPQNIELYLTQMKAGLSHQLQKNNVKNRIKKEQKLKKTESKLKLVETYTEE